MSGSKRAKLHGNGVFNAQYRERGPNFLSLWPSRQYAEPPPRKANGHILRRGSTRPTQALTLSGRAVSGDEDFSGATITKSVSMTGHFKFHYDEALSRPGHRGRGFRGIPPWDEYDAQR
jgi:hypothetical protein